MDLIDHALDTFLRRPQGNLRLPCARRVSPSKRVTQKVKRAFRYLADSCLLLIHRQLQLAHDLAHSLQGFIGLAVFAQNHKIIRIGDDSTA